MTLAEQRQAELQSVGSMSCFDFARRLSIAAALTAVSPNVVGWHHSLGITTTIAQTPPSIQQTEYVAATDAVDIQIFEALSSIYGDLLTSQRELDESATSVLYENLWDMYE